MNTTIFQFIWKERKYKIKRREMYQDCVKGGVRKGSPGFQGFYLMKRNGTGFGKQLQTNFFSLYGG